MNMCCRKCGASFAGAARQEARQGAREDEWGLVPASAAEVEEFEPTEVTEEEAQALAALAAGAGTWAAGKVGDYLFDRYAKPQLDKAADKVESWFAPDPPAVLKPGLEPVKRLADRAADAARQAAAGAAANAAFQVKIPWMQAVLNGVENAGLALDGLYGLQTRAAVQRFRTKRGIPNEGVLGPRTETALIQAALNRLVGSGLVESGIRGPDTEAAIRKYQSARSLGADGVVGPATRAAMMQDLQRGG